MTDDLRDDDHEISAAYGRLGTSLVTAGDPLARIEPAIQRRRTRRRASVGVGALVLVGGAGLGAVTLGGGDDEVAAVDRPSTAPAGPRSTLSFTRTDGSTYTFDAAGIELSCSPVENGRQTLTATSPRPVDEDNLTQPLLYVDVRVDQVAAGRRFPLPYESDDGSTEERLMTFFFATPEGGKDENELSSAEPGSSGTVEILAASCGETPELELNVDATLGSEVEQPAMEIAGYFGS